VLITDVVMPNLSGVELARRLHSSRRGIPVVYLSGNPAQVLAEDGGLDGPEVVLVKPANSGELLSAVRTALEARPTTAVHAVADAAS
jgi:FixJ family two-component response regulator